MVLGIAPMAIIDRQLPFEYAITSRSTDVVVPLPAAPAADSQAQVLSQWNVVYDAYNEVACLILGSMTPELHRQFENSSPYDMIKELKSMFEKQAGVERFDLIQTFHACKQEECGKLEGGRVGELHAMLIEYAKGLPKKAETPQVMMIKGGKIQKSNKKSLKSKDRCGEYISQEFKDYLKAYGIVQQLTPPNTPQHNGVSERRNRTLLDMVRSMMNLTTLPLSFWDYALESATRILNMVPTKKVDKTPYESWYEKVPNLSYLKFFEKNIITQEVSGRAIDLEEIQDEDTSPSEITSEIPMEVEGFEPPQEEVIPVRRSERTHRAPDCLCLNVEAKKHSLGDLNEPTSYKAAMLDSESNKWIDAMNAEIKSMMDNMIWVLVDLPPGSRLVAKGYTQLYGVDYEETFSPVADIRAIRILISIAAYYDYEIWQMDVKTAFLNGYLDEDIYMVQPEGFVDPNQPRKASRSNVTFLILYVDDIIIMGNHIPSLQSVKDYLGKCFAMKDLGEATFILRIKIYRDKSKRLIGLGQNAYMDKILKRYKMDNTKRGHIPMQERLYLNKTQGASTPKEVKRMQNVPYASAVGFTKEESLLYIPKSMGTVG
ncbi:retrotransposon protein, putative, ty1-copia subclass [Tanacetum coccineum]